MKIELSQPITLDVEAEEGQKPRRTLSGVAVPFNVDAVASTGAVRFQPGSLPTDGAAPKLIRDHDLSKPIGIVTARIADDSAMLFEARISETSDGNEALTLAADGVLDSVSVGVEVVKFHYEGQTMVVESGIWKELSLVPFGAFDTAKVLDVAAEEGDTPEPEETPTPQDSEEEIEMSENHELVEAAPAPIELQTQSLSFEPQRQVSAAQYMSDVLSGRPVIRAATQDTGDSTGILPEPIVTPLYDGLAADRRLVSALGVAQYPLNRGKTFTIPKVTQRPTVATQVDEHDALSSQAMIVGEVSVTAATAGGYVDLSEQDVDFTDPSALNLVIEQLGKAYARHTESIACGALEAGATDTDSITDWTSADEVITAIFTAQNTIVGNTGYNPTHIFLAPDRYKDLAVLQSTAGDFIFPSLNPMNAFGSLGAASLEGGAANLRIVVSPQFTAGTFIVGHSDGMRLFENQKGSIRADLPASLAVRVAWRGYFATAFLDVNKFVALVDA